MKRIVLIAALTGGITGSAWAQDPWTWHKVMPAGKTLEIKGIIGSIVATPASGNEAEVTARKTARRGNTDDVEIRVVETADVVTICAIYDGRDHCDNEGRGPSNSNDHKDTNVNFEVRVPRGVLVNASTVIGRVEVTGMTADVMASSVTGNVRVSTTGVAEASSVSGSLNIKMGSMDWNQLSFNTVSGDITIEFPDDLNTAVTMTTISGDLNSDWPITFTTTSERRIRGTIGKGGRRLSLSTISGDVELRKRAP